jgi:hypothetical protein
VEAFSVNNLFADLQKFLSGLSSIISHENLLAKPAILQGFLRVLVGLLGPKEEGGRFAGFGGCARKKR